MKYYAKKEENGKMVKVYADENKVTSDYYLLNDESDFPYKKGYNIFREGIVFSEEYPFAKYDVEACANIMLDKEIKPARDKKLALLDVDYMRADEVDDATEKATIVTKKQQLRDIPQNFDATEYNTIEELINEWGDF